MAASPFHPAAWLLWLLAALAVALLTQNPLYLTLVLLAALWVRAALGRGPAIGGELLRWAWVVPLFTTLANGLTIHIGETVIGRLPAWLPLLGGPLTLEAFAFGFASGYALLTLLVLFATFNAVVDGYALRRLVPGFLFQAGLVTSIALAFVPQTLQGLDEIREAQQIRGHRFRGWRDLPPLFLPLLTMGLERSIQLAEAMESRGFGGVERGHGRGGSRALRYKLLLLAGMMLLVVGVAIHLFTRSGLAGLATIGVALAAAGWALHRMGRKVQRSRYRTQPWRLRDTVLAVASGALLGGALLLNAQAPPAFLFYPYPRLSAPPFEPWIGAALLVLALPVWLVPRRTARPLSER